jgi:hypothetical protein
MDRYSIGEYKETGSKEYVEQLPGIGKPGDRSFGKPRPTLGFKITDDDDFATTLKFQPTGFSETSCVPKNNATSLKKSLS